jgi:hypothetical protein
MGAYCKRRKRQGRSTQVRGGICGRNPFQQKPGKPLKKIPRKAISSTLLTSVIRIKIKLLHGVTEVQGAIMALLDHCLITLQERDKAPVSSAGTNLRRCFGQKASLRISQTFTTNGVYGKRGCKPS